MFRISKQYTASCHIDDELELVISGVLICVYCSYYRGVGTAGATGALAPAMLNPGGESIFSPPQYFLTFLHAVP